MLNSKQIALGLGGVWVGVSLYMLYRFGAVSDKFDAVAFDLSKKTKVDIEKALVDKAVEKAIDRAVTYELDSAIKSASREAVAAVTGDIQSKVSKAVTSTFPDIRKSVTSEVAKQVGNIDISGLKRDVRDSAKDAILSKFDDNLNDILDDFKGNLENVSKIYGSIADAVAKKPEKEMVFRVG